MFNRLRVFKRNARDIIRERFVSIVIASLLFISLSFGTLQILSLIALLIGGAFSETASIALSVFAVVIWLFAVSPITFGYFSWMIEIFNSGKSEICEMFDVFSSRASISRSFKSVGFCFVYVFSIVIAVSYTVIFANEVSSFIRESLGALSKGFLSAVVGSFTNVSTIIFSAIFIIIWLIFLPDVVLSQYFYITAPEFTFAGALRAGTKAVKRKRFEFLILNFSFILWYVLSYFTAGILFAIFVFPYHIFTVLGFSQYSATQASVSGLLN